MLYVLIDRFILACSYTKNKCLPSSYVPPLPPGRLQVLAVSTCPWSFSTWPLPRGRSQPGALQAIAEPREPRLGTENVKMLRPGIKQHGIWWCVIYRYICIGIHAVYTTILNNIMINNNIIIYVYLYIYLYIYIYIYIINVYVYIYIYRILGMILYGIWWGLSLANCN